VTYASALLGIKALRSVAVGPRHMYWGSSPAPTGAVRARNSDHSPLGWSKCASMDSRHSTAGVVMPKNVSMRPLHLEPFVSSGGTRAWRSLLRHLRSARRLPVVVAASLAFGATVIATPAAATTPGSLAHRYAGVWPLLQHPDGSFDDYVRDGAAKGRYGEAMLGYALIERGIRSRDRLLVESGIRGINYVVQRPERQISNPSVFESWAVAAAYNVARRALAADPLWSVHRPAWEEWLNQVRPVLSLGGRGTLFNRSVVEAVARVELARTGLRSPIPGTLLSDPEGARRSAVRYLISTLPDAASRCTRNGHAVLGDPPWHHLAYHALTVGTYARGLALIGRSARRGATRLLHSLLKASWRAAAPDGDLAYVGRSSEQAWALSMTAYAARYAARGSTSIRSARRLEGLAHRALSRLARYRLMPGGLAIVPAAAEPSGMSGLDSYAGAGAYNGLTIVGLNLAATQRRRARPAQLWSHRSHATVLPAAPNQLALVRRRSVWFAVRQGGRHSHGGDLRADFGLVLAKRRVRDSWRDFVPHRPLAREPHGSVGPLLLTAGRHLPPQGRSLRVRRGRVVATADYGGRRTGVVYSAHRCGVRVSWRARRPETYEYSAFFLGRPRAGPRGLRFGSQRVRASVQLRSVSLHAGYASAMSPRLWRARMTLRALRNGPMSVTFCG
jgi:hypothetical protein